MFGAGVFLFWCNVLAITAETNPDGISRSSSDGLQYVNFLKHEFQYLDVPKVGTATVYDDLECSFMCLNTPSCFSINLAASEEDDEKLWCELLSSDKYSNSKDLKINTNNWHHFSIWSPCSMDPCINRGTCVPNYGDDTYKCLCEKGFYGTNCQPEKEPGAAPQNVTVRNTTSTSILVTWDDVPDADQNGIILSYTVTYQSQTGNHSGSETVNASTQQMDLTRLKKNTNYSITVFASTVNGDGPTSELIVATTDQDITVSSCNGHYKKHKSSVSQVVTLSFNSTKIPVYCHMGSFGCGDGGWTLAMKIDGNKSTFHYDSQYWNGTNEYNLPGGKTGFDSQETKLPTYWNTPFSKICLGMKIGNQMNFIVINQTANSLYSLIANGTYRATSLGRDTWKTLIGAQASLQLHCNREGFNAIGDTTYAKTRSRARIGFIADNVHECDTCDSRIGFGTGGHPDDSNTCGNEAFANRLPDNGEKHIKAMGYILVQ